MPRKKKQDIKVNNSDSLEGLMQEVYNDACGQINDANRVINEIHTSTTPEDVEDASKIAKAKVDALKAKDSGIKIKLEIAKLQSDILKHGGDQKAAVENRYEGKVNLSDFRKIREIMNEGLDNNEEQEED